MPHVALVGSREAELDQLEMMIRLGRTWQDLGVDPSSGDALGMDRAGWLGAVQSPKYDRNRARIYVLDSWRNRKRAEEYGFIIAQDYPEQWVAAEAMAFEARGGWGGISGEHEQFKRDLHIRNVYQIHGHTLQDLVIAMMYCARPIGRVENEKVSGGTNTALQLAKKANITHRVNLYTDEGMRWAEKFLKKYEQPYEYVETEWRQILKFDDPRLEFLT